MGNSDYQQAADDCPASEQAPTNGFRWFRATKHHPPVLQQCWHITEYAHGRPVDARTEWRTVSTFIQEPS